MKFTYVPLLALCFLFVSCSSAERMQKNAGDIVNYLQESMSGKTVEDVRTEGEELLQDAKDTKEDIENRIDKVTTGLEKIQEGKALIDEGLE